MEFTDPTLIEVAKRTESQMRDYVAAAEEEITRQVSGGGPNAIDRLTSAQQHAERRAARLARSFTVDRWIWYLRRLPPLVFDAAPQRFQVFDWYFTETTAALSAAQGTMNARPSAIRKKLVQTVLTFTAFALWDSNLRARLRCARLLVPLDESPLPRIVQEDPIAAALTLVDERRRSEAIPFARWGTLAAALTRSDADFFVFTYFRATDLHLTATEQLGRTSDLCEIRGWFYAARFDLTLMRDALADFNLNPFPGATQTLNIVVFLRVVATLVLMGKGPAEELLTSGVCYVDRALFDFACRDAIPTTRAWLSEGLSEKYGVARNSQELERQLRSHRMTLDPLRSGPLIYDVAGGIALNAGTASQELSAALEFPAITGTAANVRAHAFELDLQLVIDNSPRRPTPYIRELVRRTLRVRGQKITDIDAIAQMDSLVVAISCKSIPFRAEYDSGDLRLTYNVASQIVTAVEEWVDKVTYLQHNARGDNYDLSEYKLLPVVCTPLVMYVPLGPATEFVTPGLRRYCSATELRNWLFAT